MRKLKQVPNILVDYPYKKHSEWTKIKSLADKVKYLGVIFSPDGYFPNKRSFVALGIICVRLEYADVTTCDEFPVYVSGKIKRKKLSIDKVEIDTASFFA